jgi:hypothetical protein
MISRPSEESYEKIYQKLASVKVSKDVTLVLIVIFFTVLTISLVINYRTLVYAK